MADSIQSTQGIKLPSEVRADKAGRVGLGKALGGKLFQALCQPDGSILLVPAKVIPEREAWIFENPSRLASLDAAMESAISGKTTSLSLDELEDL